jgi:hypothetical protein
VIPGDKQQQNSGKVKGDNRSESALQPIVLKQEPVCLTMGNTISGLVSNEEAQAAPKVDSSSDEKDCCVELPIRFEIRWKAEA